MSDTIELPFITSGAELINEYLAWLRTDPDNRRPRTKNDEQAMINVLAGLGGLIEYNVRAGYQHFARKRQLQQEEFHIYSDLIGELGKHIEKEGHRKLLKISSQIPMSLT